MADILFLCLIMGFFALALLLVRGCEKLLGDAEPATDVAPEAEPERVAA
jgi:hypothetical protein